jgi:hypothetical protein
LAISRDGRQVLASAFDSVGTVRTWLVGSGLTGEQALNASQEPGCEYVFHVPPGRPAPQLPVYYMALGPDGRSLAFEQGPGGPGHCLIVRDMQTSTNVAVLPRFLGSSYAGPGFAFRPDGLLMVLNVDVLNVNPAAKDPGPARVQVWDWRKRRIVAESPPSFGTATEPRPTHRAISPSGRCVDLGRRSPP